MKSKKSWWKKNVKVKKTLSVIDLEKMKTLYEACTKDIPSEKETTND